MKMEIKIIAISKNDGWAFIVIEENLFLLRPPYMPSNLIEVSEKDVENAIHLHGFESCDITQNNTKEVVRFLKEQYVESKKSQGIDSPTSNELKELLKYANNDILQEYLEKIKSELIPKGKLVEAEILALEMMKLEKVRSNADMYANVINIIEECVTRREKREKLTMEIRNSKKENWKEKFPSAFNKFSGEKIINYVKKIQDRKSLFSIPQGGVSS